MTIEALFFHRCTIERDANDGVEVAGGYPAQPDWREHLTKQPCNFQHAPLQFGRFGERLDVARDMALGDWRLFAPSGTDIRHGDRISAVYERSGAIKHAGILQVDGDPIPDPTGRFLTVVLSGVT
jgi:hypothetical protein